VDMAQIARAELAKRGLDERGTWVGMRTAQVRTMPTYQQMSGRCAREAAR